MFRLAGGSYLFNLIFKLNLYYFSLRFYRPVERGGKEKPDPFVKMSIPRPSHWGSTTCN
jgi:hypothetical protein